MIKYNEPVEVTQKQSNAVLSKFSGLVAHRKKVTPEKETKYFIKLLAPKFAPFVQVILDENAE